MVVAATDPSADLARVTDAFQAVVTSCGPDGQQDDDETCIASVCLPQLDIEDVRPDCDDTPITLAPQAAAFVVTITGVGNPVNFPDWGSAIIVVSGGNQNPEYSFNGDGIYSGTLASDGGEWRFPKVRTVMLPGQSGDAGVTCPADGAIPTGGWGWAYLAAGGFGYLVDGQTIL